MSNTLWNKKRTHQVPDSLTHNAGTISAVFGSTTLNVVLSGLTANALYYLYVRKVSGVTSLVFVTTIPSTYRASFADAVLVGAFYPTAATTPAFGSFVNIEGVPETMNEISDGGANLIAAFVGFASFSITNYYWTRSGRILNVKWRLDTVTGNASVAQFPIPRNNGNTVGDTNARCGTYAGQNGAGNASGGSHIGSSASYVGFAGPNLNNGAISNQTGTQVVGTPPSTLTGDFEVFMANWSTTPLKDL